MRLLAAGRASEIYDLGEGRVLRRFRAGGDPEREALAMEHARGHGYPVPQVLDVERDALVLERVEGPTMLAVLARRPWSMGGQARTLAQLHRRLHKIAAPDGLPAAGPGDRLLHLDLHPGNVVLSQAGPVVLDWTNARRGEPALDVALTWVIAATSAGLGGRLFARLFLAHFDHAEIRRALAAAADLRVDDVNVSDAERRAVRKLLARES